jgi:hypothetical protein
MARPHDFLVEDRLLDEGCAAAAVLRGPRDAGPARGVQLLLPVAAEHEARLVAVGLPTGVVLVQPSAQLVAEGLLGR